MTAIDILVVGAGPAGVAAALTARAMGLDVLVVDKAGFPRDKTCGDGLTSSALRSLEALDVPVPELAGSVCVREAMLVSPSGREVCLPLPDDGERSVVVPRIELDAALVKRARDAGVPIQEHAEVSTVESREAHVRVGLSDGTWVHAEHVIAADGHWSAVRRAVSPHDAPDLGTWHAFRQYFSGVDDDRQWVLFEPDLLPGYGWVFPLADGRANVGLAMLRGATTTGKELASRWRDLIQRPRLRKILGAGAQPDESVRAWPIPGGYDPARLAHGSVLFAGDAARVVDPMTGEGIAQALETGRLAVEAIAAGGDERAVASRYRSSVERTIGRDLRFARALQRVLGFRLGARAAVRAAGLTPWTQRQFGRWLFEDYPRAAALTPDRWRRGLFTPAGSFRGVR